MLRPWGWRLSLLYAGACLGKLLAKYGRRGLYRAAAGVATDVHVEHSRREAEGLGAHVESYTGGAAPRTWPDNPGKRPPRFLRVRGWPSPRCPSRQRRLCRRTPSTDPTAHREQRHLGQAYRRWGRRGGRDGAEATTPPVASSMSSSSWEAIPTRAQRSVVVWKDITSLIRTMPYFGSDRHMRAICNVQECKFARYILDGDEVMYHDIRSNAAWTTTVTNTPTGSFTPQGYGKYLFLFGIGCIGIFWHLGNLIIFLIV